LFGRQNEGLAADILPFVGKIITVRISCLAGEMEVWLLTFFVPLGKIITVRISCSAGKMSVW